MLWHEQDAIYKKINLDTRRVIQSEGRHWLFWNTIQGDPYEVYVDHWNKMQRDVNVGKLKHILEARLRFVDGDLHGRIGNDTFLREDGLKGDFAQSATAILWSMRGRATRSKNINDHIKTGDLVSAAPLRGLAAPSTLQRWIKEEIAAGKIVAGRNTSGDARERWLSLGVPSLANQWSRRLTNCLLRGHVSYVGTEMHKHFKTYWVKDMFMPAELFDDSAEACQNLDYFTLDNLVSEQTKTELRVVE